MTHLFFSVKILAGLSTDIKRISHETAQPVFPKMLVASFYDEGFGEKLELNFYQN